MAIGEVVSNVPELQGIVDSAYFLAKVTIGIFGAWVILWVIGIIVNIRRTIFTKKMIQKLEETNKKLDSLLKKTK